MVRGGPGGLLCGDAVASVYGGLEVSSEGALVDTSDLIASNWPFLVAGVLFAVLLVRGLHDARPVRYVTHRLVLHVPVVGPLVRKVAFTRLSRTLGSLLRSGIGVLDAFAAAARTSGNEVIEGAMRNARDSVARGAWTSARRSRAIA